MIEERKGDEVKKKCRDEEKKMQGKMKIMERALDKDKQRLKVLVTLLEKERSNRYKVQDVATIVDFKVVEDDEECGENYVEEVQEDGEDVEEYEDVDESKGSSLGRLVDEEMVIFGILECPLYGENGTMVEGTHMKEGMEANEESLKEDFERKCAKTSCMKTKRKILQQQVNQLNYVKHMRP